jgi:hypothetical protein
MNNKDCPQGNPKPSIPAPPKTVPGPEPASKALDKVKRPTEKKRGREHER